MDRDAIAQAITAFYQARLSNDPAKCLPTFADDVELILAGSEEASSFAATVRHPGEFQQKVTSLLADWHWQSCEPIDTLIDGTKAVVHSHLVTDHVPTGRTLSASIVDLFEFDEACRVKRMIEFVDTAMVERLAS